MFVGVGKPKSAWKFSFVYPFFSPFQCIWSNSWEDVGKSLIQNTRELNCHLAETNSLMRQSSVPHSEGRGKSQNYVKLCHLSTPVSLVLETANFSTALGKVAAELLCYTSPSPAETSGMAPYSRGYLDFEDPISMFR